MKLSILSLAIVITLAFLGRPALAAEPTDAMPKLGDDQHAKWILVYKVDEQKTAWRPDKMDSLVAAISKRVNASWWNGIYVKGLPPDKVEIHMPPVSGRTANERQAKAELIRKIIRTTGALEFRIVATKRDNESLIEKAKAERKKVPVNSDPTKRDPVILRDPKTGKELARWCRVRDQEVDKMKGDGAAMLVGKAKGKDEQGNEVEKEVWEVLLLSPESDAYNVTGCDIRDARSAIDSETGSPQVDFSFNAAGGAKFGRLTGEHVPVGDFRYKLAILLDNELQTAPVLQSKITDYGRITGNFTKQEVEEIAAIMNAGSLPAALDPTPVRDTSIEDAVSK